VPGRLTPFTPLRVAVVAASLDILGGQGIQARALCDRLRDDGHDVVFVPVNPRLPPGLGVVRRFRGVRTIVNQLLFLPTLLRLWHADAVHVFSASYWSFLLGPAPAVAVARLLGKRVVLNYHSGEADDHLTHWGWRVHPWLRLAHAIAVPSAYLREVFARHGYAARVIPNIVDLSALPYRERGITGPRILSMRNLERHYGIDVILRAFARIKQRWPGATLTIAGYGRDEHRLRGIARSLGVDDIAFVGRQEPAALLSLCASAEVFVNASTIDNQPVSVLEAFAMGLPVISTATGDLGNMLGANARGRVIPAGDPEALAAAVAWLVEHPGEARQMVRRARAMAGAHAWAGVRDAWLSVYASRNAGVAAGDCDRCVPESR
jgi:glycosyltransferase involved in cell wall biosynthesis